MVLWFKINVLSLSGLSGSLTALLVPKHIAILQPLLAFEISAYAGVDRLAFSVMWELDVEGHVLSQWAGRTVIRSCAKLAYHHAQTIINADEDGQAQAEEAPAPLERPHTWAQASFDANDNTCINRSCIVERCAEDSLLKDRP